MYTKSMCESPAMDKINLNTLVLKYIYPKNFILREESHLN